MVAARDSCPHSQFDVAPVIQHLPVAEAQDAISERAERGVPAAIALELSGIRVVRESVDLDNEPVADEEVDPADAADLDLTADAGNASHPLIEERLRSRFADAVRST